MPTITEVCSQALGRIGSARINNYETDTAPQAIQCRLHYEQTLKSCLRSHRWQFARARASLSADTNVPAFDWTYQYLLPSDCLRVISVNGHDVFDYPSNDFVLEGNKILSNDSEANIVYVKYVTNPNDFDPLFLEFLILSLALKLLYPIAGLSTGPVKTALTIDWREANAKARLVSETENNTTGFSTWNSSRLYNQGTDSISNL